MRSIHTKTHHSCAAAAFLLLLAGSSVINPTLAFTSSSSSSSSFARTQKEQLPLTSSTPSLRLLRKNNQGQQQQQSKWRIFSASSLTSSSASEDLTAPQSSTSKSASTTTNALSKADLVKKERRELIRNEGGRWAFDTKYGALNPFAIYYGLTSILLGFPWYLALSVYQALQWLTRYRFDKNRSIPIFINHVWGVTLMRLTRCYPRMENTEILRNFYKE